MPWKRITEGELSELLATAMDELAQVERAKLELIRATPRLVRCTRGSAEDCLYVLAQTRDRALIFDDVEDEFGVATLHNGAAVESWRLYGTLKNALRKM